MWLSASGTGCLSVFAESSSSTLSHITVPRIKVELPGPVPEPSPLTPHAR
jgi:hypothetical protein